MRSELLREEFLYVDVHAHSFIFLKVMPALAYIFLIVVAEDLGETGDGGCLDPWVLGCSLW